jgi:hypothetical protein
VEFDPNEAGIVGWTAALKLMGTSGLGDDFVAVGGLEKLLPLSLAPCLAPG